MKKIMLILMLASLLLSCKQSTKDKQDIKAPKYIFYFIGDGYGPAQAHLAEGYLAQLKGKVKPQKLDMNAFPAHGTYTTYADNRFITGSAAAGTALSSGHKTTINTICMDADRNHNFKSIAEMLRDKGMKIGIVTSVSIDHATPAVFYAHQPLRSMYYDIALDLPKSNFNYFAGGGLKDPNGLKKGKKSNTMANMGIEKENVENATYLPSAKGIAEKAGYRFVNSKNEFNQLKNGDDKIIVFDPKPADGMSLPYAIDQTEENFSLTDLTEKGIELLDNPNGFFMMVEGGKIDWACHANDAATTVHEVLQFDEAIQAAYRFYEKHPDETLIIIVSDHETGGLTLGHAATKYKSNFQYLQHQNVSCERFTKIVDSIKKAKKGKYTYNDIYPFIKKHYNLDNHPGLQLDRYDIKDIKEAIRNDIESNYDIRKENPRLECAYGPYNPVTTVASRILNHKAGVDFTTYSHTALPCPARAIGVGSKKFYGAYDNTDLPIKIMELFQLKPETVAHNHEE